MALARVKTWGSELLTSADLNSEFNSILNNATSLISPATASWDMNGFEFVLDSDDDTSITSDTDDRIDFRIGGTDSMFIGHATGNTGGFLTLDPLAFTATASTDIARFRIGNTNALTVPAGTTAVAATAFFEEPNLTATGTITNAATVYIEAAPTEGGTGNYALWIDAGNVRLDGDLDVQGGDLTTTATTFNLLNVTATTVNFAGAATTINIGSGTTLQVTLTGGTAGLASAAATVALFNTTATTVNFAGGASTALNVGNASGTNTILGATTFSQALTTSAALSGATAAGAMVATQAEQETGTATDKLVSPGRQHFHPGSVKGWVKANIDGTVDGSYNVTSVTDNGTGDIIVNWATDFGDVNYCVVNAVKVDFGGAAATTFVTSITNSTFAAGTSRGQMVRVSDGLLLDPNEWMFLALGDFA